MAKSDFCESRSDRAERFLRIPIRWPSVPDEFRLPERGDWVGKACLCDAPPWCAAVRRRLACTLLRAERGAPGGGGT